MPLSYCHTCRVGTAGVHLGGESPMPEYSAGWLETKRGSNVICKHMRTLPLKTVRCEVVFTHLMCPTPRVVADMKRQVGILQVCQPLCTQFPTFFRLCRILISSRLCPSTAGCSPPSSSVCCLPNPGGSLLLCYVILPSSAWSSSRPLPSPWLPLCASPCPPIVL